MLERLETAAVEGDPLRVSSRFWWAVSHDHARVVVALHGEFDEAAAARIAPVLRALIDEHHHGVLVLDLGDVAGADPAALKLFSTVSAWARHHGTRFRPLLPDEGLHVHSPERRSR